MKKTLSLILTFAMMAPSTLVPSIVSAAAPANYQINITEPISVSGTTVNLSGVASSDNYVGTKPQQFVAIWWSTTTLSGAPEVTLPVPAASFSGKGFVYNFSCFFPKNNV